MPDPAIAYENLPGAVKHDLTLEQWAEAQRGVVLDGASVPETTIYINLKNGLCRQYTAGEPADGPLLPAHDLAGGRGTDSTQFHTAPRGAQAP
jgi:hypothetical protein